MGEGFAFLKNYLKTAGEFLRSARRMNRLVYNGAAKLFTLRWFLVGLQPLIRFLQNVSTAFFVNELVQGAGKGQSISWSLIVSGALLVVSTTLPIFIYPLSEYVWRLIWFFLDERIQILIVGKLGAVDIAQREDPKLQDLIRRVEENGVWKSQSCVDRQFYLVENIIELSLAMLALSFSNWWLFLVLVVGSLPEFWAEMRYGREVWGNLERTGRNSETILGPTFESVRPTKFH